jgi:hypothetical protein
MISNLVRRGALTIVLYGGSAEDGKPTNNSILEILTNNRLHKPCRKSSGLVTHSEWMAPEELPWLFAYSVTMHIFSDTTRMDICPILVGVDQNSHHIWNIFRLLLI